MLDDISCLPSSDNTPTLAPKEPHNSLFCVFSLFILLKDSWISSSMARLNWNVHFATCINLPHLSLVLSHFTYYTIGTVGVCLKFLLLVKFSSNAWSMHSIITVMNMQEVVWCESWWLSCETSARSFCICSPDQRLLFNNGKYWFYAISFEIISNWLIIECCMLKKVTQFREEIC